LPPRRFPARRPGPTRSPLHLAPTRIGQCRAEVTNPLPTSPHLRAAERPQWSQTAGAWWEAWAISSSTRTGVPGGTRRDPPGGSPESPRRGVGPRVAGRSRGPAEGRGRDGLAGAIARPEQSSGIGAHGAVPRANTDESQEGASLSLALPDIQSEEMMTESPG